MMTQALASDADKVSQVFKELAHPVRLKILCALLDGEHTVNEIVQFCDASQPWVSQFLHRMKLQGLVDSRKEGSFAYYRLNDDRIASLMQAVQKIYCKNSNLKKSKESRNG